jgi:hypothetical protein
MSSLLFTLAIAFVIVLISIGLLAIGWLISGRARIRAGTCGRDPTKKQDEKEGCGTSASCQLCDQTKEPPKKENDKLSQK